MIKYACPVNAQTNQGVGALHMACLRQSLPPPPAVEGELTVEEAAEQHAEEVLSLVDLLLEVEGVDTDVDLQVPS